MPKTNEIRVKANNSTRNFAPNSAKTVSEKLIIRLTKEKEQLISEVENLKIQLKICQVVSKQETELKNSCFSFLVHTKQYMAWEEYRKTQEAKSALKLIMSNINSL